MQNLENEIQKVISDLSYRYKKETDPRIKQVYKDQLDDKLALLKNYINAEEGAPITHNGMSAAAALDMTNQALKMIDGDTSPRKAYIFTKYAKEDNDGAILPYENELQEAIAIGDKKQIKTVASKFGVEYLATTAKQFKGTDSDIEETNSNLILPPSSSSKEGSTSSKEDITRVTVSTEPSQKTQSTETTKNSLVAKTKPTFKEAFAKARKDGIKEFIYDGKKYNTYTKEELKSNKDSGVKEYLRREDQITIPWKPESNDLFSKSIDDSLFGILRSNGKQYK